MTRHNIFIWLEFIVVSNGCSPLGFWTVVFISNWKFDQREQFSGAQFILFLFHFMTCEISFHVILCDFTFLIFLLLFFNTFLITRSYIEIHSFQILIDHTKPHNLVYKIRMQDFIFFYKNKNWKDQNFHWMLNKFTC